MKLIIKTISKILKRFFIIAIICKIFLILTSEIKKEKSSNLISIKDKIKISNEYHINSQANSQTSNLSLEKRIDIYKNKAKYYILFARLPYCSSKFILNELESCNLCNEAKLRGYKILEIITKEKEDLNFNLVISKSNKELVFSFGGPKSSNIDYFEKIYSTGFKKINDMLIENEFIYIYENFFKNKIIEKIQFFKNSSGMDNNLRILFIGHSFGGSIAQLAVWDLIKNGILNISETGPFIITYGALKIGPKDFVDVIQQEIKIPILRITRKIDLFSLLPRCQWIPLSKVFHCFKNYHGFITKYPVYTNYYLNYSPIAHSNIVNHIPKNVLQNYEKQYVIKQYTPDIIKTIQIHKNQIINNNADNLLIKNNTQIHNPNQVQSDIHIQNQNNIHNIQDILNSSNTTQHNNPKEPNAISHNIDQKHSENIPLNQNIINANHTDQKLIIEKTESLDERLNKVNRDKDDKDIIMINDKEVTTNLKNNNNLPYTTLPIIKVDKKKDVKDDVKIEQLSDLKLAERNRGVINQNFSNNMNKQSESIINQMKLKNSVIEKNLHIQNNHNPLLNSPQSTYLNSNINVNQIKTISSNLINSNNLIKNEPLQSLNMGESNALKLGINSNSINAKSNIKSRTNTQPHTQVINLKKEEKNSLIKNLRFVQKKKYQEYKLIKKENKFLKKNDWILFGNNDTTDSLGKFCHSHDDYLSCRFSFSDHRKFYGIDIETCE